MRRGGSLALAAAAAALALPASALAHASLTKESPSYRQRLERAPRAITLHFDQKVTALPGAIRVRAAAGNVVSGRARVVGDGRAVTVPLRPLRRGAYTVRWEVLSGDGHAVAGVYTFGVRVAAPPPTEAVGAVGPTATEDVVRWLYFVSLSLLVGGLGFRLLVLPSSLPARLERRCRLVAGAGVVASVEVGILAFILRCEDALRLPVGKLLYGDLSPMAGGTRFGKAFIWTTLGFALVAALVFLEWLTERRAFAWPAFALSLGLASGLSLSGHSAVDPGSSWLSQVADWVHLSSATLWVGGLLTLLVCVWPAAPALRRLAFLRFSRLATVLVGLLLAAGVYLSILRLPSVSDLWTQGYGQVLLVKLSLVCVALAWGAFHHFVVRPALDRGGGGGERAVGRLSRSLLGESAVAMAVLLVAAVLVDSRPPPQNADPAPARAAQR
jgi:copper transport protein